MGAEIHGHSSGEQGVSLACVPCKTASITRGNRDSRGESLVPLHLTRVTGDSGHRLWNKRPRRPWCPAPGHRAARCCWREGPATCAQPPGDLGESDRAFHGAAGQFSLNMPTSRRTKAGEAVPDEGAGVARAASAGAASRVGWGRQAAGSARGCPRRAAALHRRYHRCSVTSQWPRGIPRFGECGQKIQKLCYSCNIYLSLKLFQN